MHPYVAWSPFGWRRVVGETHGLVKWDKLSMLKGLSWVKLQMHPFHCCV